MSTFVLVHGAGTGGWLWDGVAARLRASGHDVDAPSLVLDPGADLSDHVNQVVELVDERRDVVLVGFSYGGLVISGAADLRPDAVRELVFVDAFLPRPGACFLDLLPPPVRATMEQGAERSGGLVPPAPVEAVGGVGALEPGVDPDHVAAVLARRAGHPITTYRAVAAASTAVVRRRFVVGTDKPPGDPLVALAAGLRAAGWRVDELPTGHFAMLSMPDALTNLLLSTGLPSRSR